MKTTNKFLALAFIAAAVAFTSCNDNGAPKSEIWPEASDNAETTTNEFVGKWERRTTEGKYTLTLTAEGTGKLVTYEQATYATLPFKYTVTDKGVVVEWNKLTKETYYASFTVDGKYMVLDNGSNVYVYKKNDK